MKPSPAAKPSPSSEPLPALPPCALCGRTGFGPYIVTGERAICGRCWADGPPPKGGGKR